MRQTKNVLIPARDGVLLAADLYAPDDPAPCPAVLTFFPYHKDGHGGNGSTRTMAEYFAAHGYASLIVDFRGTGNSAGVAQYPFSEQERLDGHDVVEWIAAQPWCSGKVGMWGVSYGGISSLSVASTRPPHLKAIIPVHACTDNHTNFLRLGGCRGGFWSEGDWGARMILYNLTPPLYQDPAGRWAQVWQERLDNFRPWILNWHEHPLHDLVWDRRVIPADRITVPTFAICGWHDFYPQSTIDFYNAVQGPKRLLMGPWKHVFPDASPTAPYGGMVEMERWFARWLKDELNGLEAEAPVTIYVQGAGWRHENAFPPARATETLLTFAAGRQLLAESGATTSGETTCQVDPRAGIYSLPWDPWTTAIPYGLSGADTTRISLDDLRGCAYEGPSLDAPLEIIGTARLALTFTSSTAAPAIAVKLCEVDNSGISTLITMGWLQLDKADPGIERQVEIPLRPTAYQVPAGHHLRISITGADFPRIWPVAELHTITVKYGDQGSCLMLPVTAGQGLAGLEPFLPDLVTPGKLVDLSAVHQLEARQQWRVIEDLAGQSVTLEALKGENIRIDAETIEHIEHRYAATVARDRPQDATIQVNGLIEVQRAIDPVTVKVELFETVDQLDIVASVTRSGQPYWKGRWTVPVG